MFRYWEKRSRAEKGWATRLGIIQIAKMDAGADAFNVSGSVKVTIE